MKKVTLPAEVLAAIVTIIGTLMVGIILGVLEGKIGFISVLGFVALMVLGLLLYLLYKRSGPKVTAVAGVVMLVVGFAVFALFFRKPMGTADTGLTQTPTATPAAAPAVEPTQTPQSPATTLPAVPATAAPTVPPASVPTQALPTIAATRLPTATPKPARTAAAGESVEVLTTVISEFFAPGPKPAAIAVGGDVLWVGDADQKLVYQVDKSGVPKGTFPVTPKGTVQALAWDGEALRIATGDYLSGEIGRVDATGTVLESFSVPFKPCGLAWDASDSTLWTGATEISDSFLVQFSADGRLLQIVQVGIFGSLTTMTRAPDGFWVISVFGDWQRFDAWGTELRKGELPMDVFASAMGIARDADGTVWLAVANDRKIYKFATQSQKLGLVPTATPNSGSPGALPLPQPAFEDMPGNKATVIVTNNLGGPMTVSFDTSQSHETAILQPGETWTAYLDRGSYSVFFSANAPSPVAFGGKELILPGYQYTWVVSPPQ